MPRGELYSFEEAEAEAEKMKEKVAEGEAETYDQAEKLLINEIWEEWDYEGKDLILFEEESERFQQIRERYLDVCVERPYKKFLAEQGEIKAGSLTELIESIGKFKVHEASNKTFTKDVGRKFWVDALLNDDQALSQEEIDYIRAFFDTICPNSSESNLFIANPELLDEFIEKYPKKDSLEDSLVYLAKKSLKQGAFQGGFVSLPFCLGAVAANTDQITQLQMWQQQLLQDRDDLARLGSPISQGEKGGSHSLDNSKTTTVFMNLIKNLPDQNRFSQKVYPAWKEELLEQVQAEFGIDFRPPEFQVE